jgi:protein dithiol oxidoreductase (disulfide-forming)
MTFRSTLFVLLAAFAPGFAPAQDFKEGEHYFAIEDAATAAETPAGKVEVVEVFSYACPACATFQPGVDKWRATAPAAAAFRYLPAAWNPNWEAFARAYYAAESLGLLTRTHRAMFKALHQERAPLRTIDDIANWYTKYGVTREQFMAAYNAPETVAKVEQAKKLVPAWKVDSTPTIVIGGKYRTNGRMAGSQERLFQLIDQLVKQESAAP